MGNGFCTSHGREKTITQNPSESQPVSSNKPSLRQVGLAMKFFSFYWIFFKTNFLLHFWVFFFKTTPNVRLWLLAIQCPRLQMKADFHPDTLKWNVHMCLMLLLFIAASLQHVGFHLMPFLTICNLKKIFKALHSQRVQVPVYREQMDVIIQGHLSASSELLVSGFNCFDWCLRWRNTLS